MSLNKKDLRELPVGVQDFAALRQDGMLYVDKTQRLLDLVRSGRRYFLSRPRRFGKSLTLSTLEAMFRGRSELFTDLAAEDWVKKQADSPYLVLRFDMSSLASADKAALEQSLKEMIARTARKHGIILPSASLGGMLIDLLEGLFAAGGPLVILIDEYDKPILDSLTDAGKAEEIREILRVFYTTLKSCDGCLRFVFITGISKFSKVGIFSALNNLLDISLTENYGDITGYTQRELETNFSAWIDHTASNMRFSRTELLERMQSYYDGFSFDGKTKLYNPFSVLSFFATGEFHNFWYESGSPSFIVNWMRDHAIKDPEEYRHITVKSDFTASQEIERADASSFLFQSGYLTIEKKQDLLLILDYPNREVLDSLSGMYLKLIYKVEGYASLGQEIWQALRRGNLEKTVQLYNTALAGIPYDDYLPNRHEFWYRSLFLMLLRGSGIIAYSEPHTSKGRADIVIQLDNTIIVLEFKFAPSSAEIESKQREGILQMQDKEYTKGYIASGYRVIAAVLTADAENRRIYLHILNKGCS